ncbi:hypothetical protein D5F01_LYC15239 [Larimichthys crocea]|uniref:HAT C-terminal dimerisation domain-containing protein n=1 Tax=Larimichthys crocea TaxID=215358 RepID=A0A6G0I7C7_LARCR|nr:hypothetical protein D5F01_LYC15239 [Larimichthys crocea]
MVNALSSGMSARFCRMESNHILADAAGLDPRFKRMAFMDGRTADEAFQTVLTAAARFAISSSEPIQQPVQEEGAGSAAPESVVWSYFHEEVAGTVATQNPTADAVMEVRAYLGEPLFPKNEDPLKWWKSREPVYGIANLWLRSFVLRPHEFHLREFSLKLDK